MPIKSLRLSLLLLLLSLSSVLPTPTPAQTMGPTTTVHAFHASDAAGTKNAPPPTNAEHLQNWIGDVKHFYRYKETLGGNYWIDYMRNMPLKLGKHLALTQGTLMARVTPRGTDLYEKSLALRERFNQELNAQASAANVTPEDYRMNHIGDFRKAIAAYALSKSYPSGMTAWPPGPPREPDRGISTPDASGSSVGP